MMDSRGASSVGSPRRFFVRNDFPSGIQHGGESFHRSKFIGLDHYATLRVFSVQPFDVGTHGAHIDTAFIDPNAIVGVDGYQHRGIVFLIRRIRVRSINFNASFFDKCRGDNKKDQHDKHHIKHGC